MEAPAPPPRPGRAWTTLRLHGGVHMGPEHITSPAPIPVLTDLGFGNDRYGSGWA